MISASCLSVVPLFPRFRHISPPQYFVFAPPICFCLRFVDAFQGAVDIFGRGPAKFRRLLLLVNMLFPHTPTDQNICRPSDKWKTQNADHSRPRNWAKLFEQYENKTCRNYNLRLVTHLQFVTNKCCFCTNVADGYCVICAKMFSVFVCQCRSIAKDYDQHYLYLFPIVLSLHWLWR